MADPPDVNALLQRAPWRFRFSFAAGRFDWTYSFRGITGIDLESRDFEKTDEPLLMPQERELDEFGVERGDGRSQPCRVRADASTAEGIGPVEGRFYVFDRDLNVLRRLGESQSIRHYLDANGGIRVYRDGIRVYNYGEPGDDWLGTDLGRGERPTRSLSRNVVIGAVDLSLAASGGLVERTNREGFVENPTFRRLRRIVTGALMPLHVEHDRDKTKMRRRATSIRNAGTGHDTRPLQELRALACRHNLSDDLEPLVDAAERDYDEFRNSMLRTALSGMSLAVIFHEVQHGVRTLCDLVEKGDDPSAARTSARELARALEGYADLLRKGARRPYSLNRLIRRARDINRVRFRKHRVRLDCPALDVGVPDVTSSFVFGLALGALNNLLDNAFYWLRVRWPDEDAGLPGRAIHISTNLDLAEGPAIVVADTGPGFMDEPEEMTRPFFSRRPEGMGVGLYYANLVMELGGGRLRLSGCATSPRTARVRRSRIGARLSGDETGVTSSPIENDDAFSRRHAPIFPHLLRTVSTPPDGSDLPPRKPRSFSEFRGELVNEDGFAAVPCVSQYERDLRVPATYPRDLAQTQVHVQKIAAQHAPYSCVLQMVDASLQPFRRNVFFRGRAAPVALPGANESSGIGVFGSLPNREKRTSTRRRTPACSRVGSGTAGEVITAV